MISERFSGRLNRFVLLPLTLSAAIFFLCLNASAATYSVPQTTGAEIAWDHNDPQPEGYRIYQRKSGENYDYTNPVWTGTGNSGTVYNLDYDTTYYFVVRAFEGTEESVDSEEVSFTAQPPGPETYSISATASQGGSVSPEGVTAVIEGADQTYTISPNSGYHIADVSVDGISLGSLSSYAFTSVDSSHSIIVSFEADATAVDDPVVAPDDNSIDSGDLGGGAVTLQIEGEDGSLTWPMQIGDHADASAGGFVCVPSNSQEEGGCAEYYFQIPEAGEYVIWARQISSGEASDSFIVSVDGQEEIIWHTMHGGTEVWTWDVISERSQYDERQTEDPVIFNFTAGLHLISIKQGESGTKLDKLLITNQISQISPVNDTNLYTIVFGEVEINHEWARVDFERPFVNPVVVAGPLSLNGSHPAVVRIKDVDGTGFDIRVQEWDYLDGGHAVETVSYLVMEQGTYMLEDGTMVEARTVEADASGGDQAIGFQGAFNIGPVLMTSLTSFNDTCTATGRVKQVTRTGFSYRMQEQEANPQDHGRERMSYIAWEPSSGTVGGTRYLVETTANAVATDAHEVFYAAPFDAPPAVLADMQTTNGGNTANVRSTRRDAYSFGVLVSEEQSHDDEVDHCTEAVGYMVFGR